MGAFLLREIYIAERAMELHSRAQHVGVHNKLLTAFRTCYFYRLTHSFLLNKMLKKATSGVLSREASQGWGLGSFGPCWTAFFSILLFLV
jgi:hypothetical protein